MGFCSQERSCGEGLYDLVAAQSHQARKVGEPRLILKAGRLTALNSQSRKVFEDSLRAPRFIYPILSKSSVQVVVNSSTEDSPMQTELFDLPTPRTLTENPADSKVSCLEKKFITLRLDQTIGLALVLLVIYVLTFSWGVEKGKRSSREIQGVRTVSADVLPPVVAPVAIAKVSRTLPAESVQDRVPMQVPIPVAELPKPVAKVAPRQDGKFTIQHVTYMTQSAADREIQKLAQKGYQAFVIPSGKHRQVCIAAFQSRQDASKILSQLRNQNLVSGDAYVRPMVR
jgi:cell division septation protein DedD